MKARTLIVFALALGALAGAAHAEMSAQQIIARMEQQRGKIKDYTAELEVAFDMPRVRVAPMKVKVYYKHPNRVKAEPLSGFAIIPKRGLTMEWPHPDLDNVNVAVSRVRHAGRPAYLLEVTPRQDRPSGGPATSGRLWVDRERWVPLRFEMGEPAGSPHAGDPRLAVQASYTRVGSGYWLPEKVTVEMTMPSAEGKREKGTITLEFGNYRVNTGLSDKIFEEKPKK